MFFLPLGLLLLIVGIVIFLYQRDLHANGRVVLGEVVDIQVNEDIEGDITYTYTVQFLTPTAEVKFWKMSTGIENYGMGEKVPLIYHPRLKNTVDSLHFLNSYELPFSVAGWESFSEE